MLITHCWQNKIFKKKSSFNKKFLLSSSLQCKERRRHGVCWGKMMNYCWTKEWVSWECLEAIYKQSIYMTAIAARKGSNRNVLICIVRWSLIKITFLRGNFNGCLFRKIWKCPAVSNNDIQIATTTLRNFPTAIIAWLTAISPLSFISYKKITCEGDLIWYAYYNNRASLRLQQINKRIKMKNRNLHFPQLQFVVEFCCHSKITQFFSYIK